MKTIYGVALRLFKTNKFIVFSSVFGIAVAVCLFITIVLYAESAKKTVSQEIKDLYGEMDLYVEYTQETESTFYRFLEKTPEIEEISKVIVTQAQVDSLQADIYTVGVENDSLAKSRYKFNRDLNNKSVVMNESLAEALNLKVGEQVKIEQKTFILTDIISDLKETGIAPDRMIFSRESVLSFIHEQKEYDTPPTYIVMIKTLQNIDFMALSNKIIENNSDVKVTIVEEDEFLKSNINSLTIFVKILSIIVLCVTSLLIVSNFDLLLYKNKNQLAILRSIGATAKQLVVIIFVQSSLINLTGVLFGFLLSWGSQQFMHGWLEKLFSFDFFGYV